MTLMGQYLIAKLLYCIFLFALATNNGLAATAYATVTAKIVPWSSFRLTEPIILTQLPLQKTLQTDINNQAKISVRSNQSTSYSISISPSVEKINAAGQKITLTHLRVLNEQQQSNIEKTLKIQGVLADDLRKTDHLSKQILRNKTPVILMVNFY